MEAIRYVEAGRPELVEAPTPRPGRGQVLLKIEAVTTCPQWDLHLMEGESMAPGGVIEYPTPVGHPGHEAVGEVVELGDGVAKLAVGDRAALWQDQGAGRDGCYAQYVVADEANLLKVSKDLRAEQIASLELAMCIQVSFDQLLNVGPLEGKRFGVSGLGPAGLLGVQLARAFGAAEVIAFDPVEERRRLALQLGATAALDPMEEDAFPYDRFQAEKRLQVSIECTGLAASGQYLMQRTREAVALFGVLREEVNFGFFHWCGGLHLIGYGQQNRGAAERALARIETGRLRLDPLVTETLPLSDYLRGVEMLERKKAIKICFRP